MTIAPSPNSYSIRICSNNFTLALLSTKALLLFSRMLQSLSGESPFNAPPPGTPALMNGFVKDYIIKNFAEPQGAC